MDSPFFSIVVPTRNRGFELYYTLKTCLEQDFAVHGIDAYEIVVSDNDSQDDIRKIVEGIGSERIRYVRTDRYLSMTDSWEFALAQARGRYVGFVCTDDGYLLSTLSNVHKIILDTKAQAVTFQGATYYWPSHDNEEYKDKIFVPHYIFEEGVQRSERLIEESLQSLFYGRLPCFLNSFCSAELIGDIRKRTGRIFRSNCPDVYSGFLVAAHVAEIYVSNRLMLVGGVSGKSTGANAFFHPSGDVFTEHIARSDEPLNPRLGGFGFVATLIVDSAIKALLQAGYPNPMKQLDIGQYAIMCYRQAIAITDPLVRQRALTAIDGFMREHPRKRAEMRSRIRWKRFVWALRRILPSWLVRGLQRLTYERGRSSGGLAHQVIPAREHGVSNIYDAAVYVTKLLETRASGFAPQFVRART